MIQQEGVFRLLCIKGHEWDSEASTSDHRCPVCGNPIVRYTTKAKFREAEK